MDTNATDMAVLDGFGQHLDGEIFGALAGVEDAAAQVYRIGAVTDGGLQCFHGPGGC